MMAFGTLEDRARVEEMSNRLSGLGKVTGDGLTRSESQVSISTAASVRNGRSGRLRMVKPIERGCSERG